MGSLPNGKWVFSGVMNGWPGLGYHCPLEVLSITYKPRKSLMLTKGKSILRWWGSDKSRSNAAAPTIPPANLLCDKQSVRVTLRTPTWASRGWTSTSPGFCWYYDGNGTTVLHGTDMLTNTAAKEILARNVHMFQHRYAMPEGKRESAKDMLTFHAAILIEWENGTTSLVELALVNGIGGYRGRANWYHDKYNDILGSLLYRSLPPQMILPWKTDMCEIRFYDLPHCPDLSSFEEYLRIYSGPGKR